jgi:dipeptidyl aminopeptidase/acylaminoacyl peptidase
MRLLNHSVASLLIPAAIMISGCAQQSSVTQQTQSAQEPNAPAITENVTAEDYQRAEQMLWQNTHHKVYQTVNSPMWQDNDQLIYTTRSAEGLQYVLVNPETGDRQPAFDHQQLADQLNKITERDIPASQLPLGDIELTADGQVMTFSANGDRFSTNLATYETKRLDSNKQWDETLSPDGKWAAYIKDYNLWVRNTETDEKIQLTQDGEQHYGYATNNAGWIKSDRPVLLWSPDSKKIATFQHDSRGVGEMYLYNTKVGHSDLEKWKYPLPGDSTVFRIERVVVHVDKEDPKVVRLDMDPDYHRSTISDHIADWGGRFLDVEWSDDSEELAFVSSSRDHKVAQLRTANPNNGEVRDVLREEEETYYESGYSEESWRVLEGSDEVIWFSERSNWGHLYLYDLNTGEMKQPITSGEWRVLDLHWVDEENRTIYFTGSNREDGNPYYHYLYKVNMDGSGLTLLTPEPMNHEITWSDSKQYFIDTYSTPDTPPVTVIRNLNGEVVAELEEADISPLEDHGWIPPEQFTVKARDGETDLYGLMYKPSNFDPNKKYPVLNYLYPGPQSGSVGSRSFRPSRGDKQALAELGFIVVEVDAMGTPGRSKSYHDAYYGDMGDNGLPDQVSMIKQLGDRNTWMDLDRVGIWGHSGGGFASTRGILAYPDFYKVAVSGAGNHDNRNYEDDWGEKWHGLLEPAANNAAPESPYKQGDSYDTQANQLYVDNLKGNLLIAHGLMDSNVPPSNTLLMVEALQKADKDFDLMVFPNAGHGFGNSRYFMNMRWDYFVEHLIGVTPPDYVFEDNIR